MNTILQVILQNNNLVNELLTPIIAAVGTALAGFITYGIARFTKWITTKTKNEKLEEAINRIETIIYGAVKTTNQQFVDDLKKAGKFDAKAQKEAFEKTLANVKKLLTKELEEILGEAFGDIELYLEIMIERYVVGYFDIFNKVR